MPPAVKQLTYVSCQSIAAGQRRPGRSRRSRCPATLPAVTSVRPSSTIVRDPRRRRGSARPAIQNRPVTLGSIVVPEMSLPPCSMISTSMSSNGSGGDERPGLLGELAARRRRRRRRPRRARTATTSPNGDSTEATPPSRRPVARSAAMPASRRSRIPAAVLGVELGGAGLLAEADDGHLRAAALDRAPGTPCAA